MKGGGKACVGETEDGSLVNGVDESGQANVPLNLLIQSETFVKCSTPKECTTPSLYSAKICTLSPEYT